MKKTRSLLRYLLVGLVVLMSGVLLNLPNNNAIQGSQVIKVRDFRLEVTNQWDSSAQKNYADLVWDSVPDLSGNGYTMYQSGNGTEWVAKSTQYGKAISVLNVYPNSNQSNTLKGWMGSLNLKDQDNNQLINVTPVSLSQFNSAPNTYLKDKNGNYQFDVIMFGSWDSYNQLDLNQTSYLATRAFSDSGRGILMGHDTAYYAHPWFMRFAKDLGLTETTSVPGVNWAGHNEVQIVDNGYLMKYPFELANNAKLSIPYTHTIQYKLKASPSKIWLKFTNTTLPYQGPIVDNATLTNNWYLLTANNLAMIQTGHSNGASTLDERKIIANTLYNLAQISLDTVGKDYSVIDDVPPKKPDLTASVDSTWDSLKIEMTATDRGKNYQFYVEASTKLSGIKNSDVVQEEIISDIQGYIYQIDNQPGTLPVVQKNEFGQVTNLTATITNPNDSRTAVIQGLSGQDQEKWLHVLAVDRANNVSEVTHIQLKELMPVFRITEKHQNSLGVTLKADTFQDIIKGKNYWGAPEELPNDYVPIGFKFLTGEYYNNPRPILETVLADETLIYIYEKRVYTGKIHLQQVILSSDSELVVPELGLYLLKNRDSSQNPVSTVKKIMNGVSPSKADAFNDYATLKVITEPDFNFFEIEPILPEYYQLAGFVVSTIKPTNPQLQEPAGPIILNIKAQSDYWVTVYLKPNDFIVKPYSWSYGVESSYDVKE